MEIVREDAIPTIGTLAEFQRGWSILVGAMIGLGVGSAPMLFYTSGLFVGPLQREIGLTRTQFGVAMLLATLSQAGAAPLVGALIDKVGIRLPIAISAVALAAGFLLMSLTIATPAQYIWLNLMVACFATAGTPVTYSRGIVAWFVRARGLALGVALTGIGLSVAIVPLVVATVIGEGGWRAGYRLLGVLTLVGGGGALLLMRKVDTIKLQRREGSNAGANFRESIRSRAFLIFTLAFGVQAAAVTGLVNHFVPLLTDVGVSQLEAAKYAAIIGIGLMLSRLLVGWLTDRIFAPWVASAVCLVCALGSSGLLIAPRELAGFSAFAIGCAMGAEIDIIGYFVARYFGMQSYGRLYGVLFAIFMIGSGISPLWIGATHDIYGSYSVPLVISLAGMILAAVLFLLSPRYPETRDSD